MKTAPTAVLAVAALCGIVHAQSNSAPHQPVD